jgi:ubiquinone/menaquinone biosynthesis C-methylase UbiE
MANQRKVAVNRQFSASAQLYAESWIHSEGYTLHRITELAKLECADVALDIATGAGHTALAIASHARQVVASDLSLEMLEMARSLSQRRGLDNVFFIAADAEALTFKSDCFDLVTCRIAPHHFLRPDLFVNEVRRILKTNGRFLLVDTWVPDQAQIDDFINQIQILRDPTHRRSLSTLEWKTIIESARLKILSLETWVREGETSFNEWVTISRTLPQQIEQLKSYFRGSTNRVSEALKIKLKRRDISFQIPRLVLMARKQD